MDSHDRTKELVHASVSLYSRRSPSNLIMMGPDGMQAFFPAVWWCGVCTTYEWYGVRVRMYGVCSMDSGIVSYVGYTEPYVGLQIVKSRYNLKKVTPSQMFFPSLNLLSSRLGS